MFSVAVSTSGPPTSPSCFFWLQVATVPRHGWEMVDMHIYLQRPCYHGLVSCESLQDFIPLILLPVLTRPCQPIGAPGTTHFFPSTLQCGVPYCGTRCVAPPVQLSCIRLVLCLHYELLYCHGLGSALPSRQRAQHLRRNGAGRARARLEVLLGCSTPAGA